MKVENTKTQKQKGVLNMKAQMRKGVLELCILSIIAEEEAYPSDILKRLKGSELSVKEGTIYPLLTRLKNAGILSYNWRESTGGPPRKYYNITEAGQEFLTGLLGVWQELVQAVTDTTKHLQN